MNYSRKPNLAAHIASSFAFYPVIDIGDPNHREVPEHIAKPTRVAVCEVTYRNLVQYLRTQQILNRSAISVCEAAAHWRVSVAGGGIYSGALKPMAVDLLCRVGPFLSSIPQKASKTARRLWYSMFYSKVSIASKKLAPDARDSESWSELNCGRER